jgi:hypothetical protein
MTSDFQRRIKLAVLWIIYIFVFTYTDYCKLFIPGVLGEISSGRLDGVARDQAMLFVSAVITIIPALMIFLSLVIPAAACRWTSIACGAAISSGAVRRKDYALFMVEALTREDLVSKAQAIARPAA